NRRLAALIAAVMLTGVLGRAQAQNSDEVIASVEKAILGANANALAQYFDNQVEITIGDKDNIYSKDQATFVVKEFFQNYPVRSFKILHKGSSSDTYY